MPGANFAFVTEWVTYSVCPFWTGTQRYRNELGDRNHVILLSDLCCGDHHHHVSPGDSGASEAAAGTTCSMRCARTSSEPTLTPGILLMGPSPVPPSGLVPAVTHLLLHPAGIRIAFRRQR